MGSGRERTFWESRRTTKEGTLTICLPTLREEGAGQHAVHLSSSSCGPSQNADNLPLPHVLPNVALLVPPNAPPLPLSQLRRLTGCGAGG